MLTRRVRCTGCHTPLAPALYNSGGFHECPGCSAPIRVEVFSALIEPPRLGAPSEEVLIDGEPGCFFHPTKKAVRPCDGCGRFLCNVCDIELGGRHFCPQCLESGKRKGKLQEIENRRTLYDSLALALATYPLLIFYFTLITAPFSIYIAIRYWKAPSSIIPRSRWRFVVALILASSELVGWAALFIAILA